MRLHNLFSKLVYSLLLGFSGPIWAVDNNGKHHASTLVGQAFDVKTNDLLYTEYHKLSKDENERQIRKVEYYDASNQLIASKTNQASDNPLMPRFKLEDYRNEYTEEALLKNGQWYLEKKDYEERSYQLLPTPRYQPVIDIGFHDLILKEWDALLAGETIRFSFAAAARMSWVNFRLVPTKVTDDQLVMEIRLNSRWLAWLVKPIELTYDRQYKRLSTYRGLTNIQDSDSHGIRAQILYSYHD